MSLIARRLGVFGGTFDPVHVGHLRIAEEAVEFLGLDLLLFVPAAVPPHKGEEAILPFECRYEMLRLGIQGNPRFLVSGIEKDLPGKSYTVVTLGKLREQYSQDVELFFLVGMDAFFELDSWWHYRDLFRSASIVVLRRHGYCENSVADFLRVKVSPLIPGAEGSRSFQFQDPAFHPVYLLPNTSIEVSSSRIRQMVARGRSIRYLVPWAVMRYIQENRLYRFDTDKSNEKGTAES
ncbi:MAG: nicotinate-nucleotide adenylyltransferase [Syntrophobacteraceae bacterium]|nr:nicotinate-nucleotide adenylyltransferase [Syntrophobacteraceae bacterium]